MLSSAEPSGEDRGLCLDFDIRRPDGIKENITKSNKQSPPYRQFF